MPDASPKQVRNLPRDLYNTEPIGDSFVDSVTNESDSVDVSAAVDAIGVIHGAIPDVRLNIRVGSPAARNSEGGTVSIVVDPFYDAVQVDVVRSVGRLLFDECLHSHPQPLEGVLAALSETTKIRSILGTLADDDLVQKLGAAAHPLRQNLEPRETFAWAYSEFVALRVGQGPHFENFVNKVLRRRLNQAYLVWSKEDAATFAREVAQLLEAKNLLRWKPKQPISPASSEA